MKRLKDNIWTDGKDQYTGSPNQGFVKIEKPKPSVVSGQAFDLETPKKVDKDEK